MFLRSAETLTAFLTRSASDGDQAVISEPLVLFVEFEQLLETCLELVHSLPKRRLIVLLRGVEVPAQVD